MNRRFLNWHLLLLLTIVSQSAFLPFSRRFAVAESLDHSFAWGIEIAPGFEPSAGIACLKSERRGPRFIKVSILDQSEASTDSQGSTFVIGGLIPDNYAGDQHLEVLMILRGADKKSFISNWLPISKQVSTDQGTLSSIEELRQLQKEAALQLKSWSLQSQAQEESLERLHKQVEKLGNFSQLIDLKEQTNHLIKENARLLRDKESLEKSLQKVRVLKSSRTNPAHEGQLTTQIAALAEAVRVAEKQGSGFRVQVEHDLQKKLLLLEETREEDLDQLQRELVKLRRQNAQKERAQEEL